MTPISDFGMYSATLKTTVSRAWEVSEQLGLTHYYDDSDDSEIDQHTDLLAQLIDKAFIQIHSGIEALGLTRTLDQFVDGFEKHRSHTTKLHTIDADIVMCPAVEYLSKYSEAILALLGHKDEGSSSEKVMLRRILMGTGKIISDQHLTPSEERSVQEAVLGVLIHSFPDAISEPPIRKVFKTFKPDVGVPSLETAIEYKFVDSRDEMKRAVAGVYEDMQGYNGSKDWKEFISVFYQTDHFYLPSQLEAEFSLSKVSDTWIPLLVTGRGKRLKRPKQQKR